MLHNFTSNETHTPDTVTKAYSIMVVLNGTWGGGTVSLQIYEDSDASWHELYEFTEDGSWEIAIGWDKQYRFVMAGGTGQDLDVVYDDIKTYSHHSDRR